MSTDRIHLLRQLLEERILILDGAMGTMIQSHRLDAHQYHGDLFHDHACDQKGNNDLLTLTQPQIIRTIHTGYLEAGADILETNTFNSTRIAMADYGMEDAVLELNRQGARLARAAADEWTKRTPQRPRFVAGVLGPTNRTASISPDVNDPGARNVSFDELVAGVPRSGRWPGAGRRRPAAWSRPSSTRSTPRPRSSPSRTGSSGMVPGCR